MNLKDILPSYEQATKDVESESEPKANRFFQKNNTILIEPENHNEINEKPNSNQVGSTFKKIVIRYILWNILRTFYYSFFYFLPIVLPYVALLSIIIGNSTRNALDFYLLKFDFSNSTFNLNDDTGMYQKRDEIYNIYPKSSTADIYETQQGYLEYHPYTETVIYSISNDNSQESSTSTFSSSATEFVQSYTTSLVSSSVTTFATTKSLAVQTEETELTASELGIYDVYQLGVLSWYKWNLNSNGKKINITRGSSSLNRGINLNEELNIDSKKENHTIYIKKLYYSFSTDFCNCGETFDLRADNRFVKSIFPMAVILLVLIFSLDIISLLTWKSNLAEKLTSNLAEKLTKGWVICFFYICPPFLLTWYLIFSVFFAMGTINYKKGIEHLNQDFTVSYSSGLQAIVWLAFSFFLLRCLVFMLYGRKINKKALY